MVVSATEYSLSSSTGTDYDLFFPDDMDELMDQSMAFNLELRYARCYNSGCTAGGIHTIAIAVNFSGSPVSGGKAALPCPPDCPIKYDDSTLIHFDDYEIERTHIVCPRVFIPLMKLFGFKFYKISMSAREWSKYPLK